MKSTLGFAFLFVGIVIALWGFLPEFPHINLWLFIPAIIVAGIGSWMLNPREDRHR